MIRKVLTLLDQGSLSFSELAMTMDMTQAELKARMEMMVRMGHLEAVPLRANLEEPGRHCPGCILSGRCKSNECSDGAPIMGYRLTDKGRRLARKGDQQGEGREVRR